MRLDAFRVGYLGASTTAVAAGLGVVAGLDRAGLSAVAAGAVAALVIQLVSFWRLVAALDAGASATRVWLAGIAARAGGLGLAIVAGRLWGAGGERVPLAYGSALLVLLLLEAAWLARRGRRETR